MRSRRGSSGRPSTRSPTMLRWISSVPPRIESDGAVRNSVCHSPVRIEPRRRRGCASRGWCSRRNGAAAAQLHARALRTGPAGTRGVARAAGRERHHARVDDSRASASRTTGSDAQPARPGERDEPVDVEEAAAADRRSTAPRSNDRQVSATRQPSPTAPMRSASGIRRVVEEDLGEVRVAVHLPQRPHVDSGGAQVERRTR